MKLIKVAAASLNQTPFDWENNTSNIRAAIEAARQQQVTILCLPELCITGYGCEDDFFRTDLRTRAWQILQELLPLTHGMIVSLGLPVMYNNALFNCAALVSEGQLLGLVAKQNLAGDGIHYEPRWFEAWQENVVAHLHVDGKSYPIGDIHFDVGGIKIGFEICEDAWVGRRPGARLTAKGVDIFLNPSASHFAMGKLETRKRLVVEGSRAFSASYIYANLLGNEAGRAIYDGGSLIASAGKLQVMGPRFSFNRFELTTAVIDIDHTRMAQARTYSFRPQMEEQADDCVRTPFQSPQVPLPAARCPEPPAWEGSEHAREEEFARSLALGLFDYLRKTRSHGYTVSLSGGADSSAVCCLVSLMVELAVQQLGMEQFKRELAYIPGIASVQSTSDAVNKLLSCAYQGSKNSSAGTLQSARALANGLGATLLEFNIAPLVDEYTRMVASALGRELTWQTDDIALQNIQARVRSPGIWLLANLKNSVLLCTSNRSEGALGYCTMDGDTSGGLAPIAGVDKNFVRRWLRWLEKTGPLNVHPYPMLSAVNKQTPGPELRPPTEHQAGESDLMPYDVLEEIEEAAIENNQSVSDCYQLMRSRFPQYNAPQIAEWVEKFFKLWSRNQWKRERLAPALHVASRNLDPRTWRRSPILSGGFRKEITEMRECIEDERSPIAARKNGGGGKRALLVVDAQNGFGSKGELPVPDAEAIVPVINRLLPNFDIVVATQDWHPAQHVSFAQFPVHCVQNTPGAEFIAGLQTNRFSAVFKKGTSKDVDSFSAFIDNAGAKATDVEQYLKNRGVTDLYVCGLATNYCVLRSVLDAVKLGFRVHLVEDACRGIDEPAGAVQEALHQMRNAGVTICSSEALLKDVSAIRRH